MNIYAQAARYLAQVQRAGARHSAKDNSIVQQLHDLSCELGAECPDRMPESVTVEELRRFAPNPMLKAAVEALILRHPGHASQKTHGNRHGVGGLREFAEKRGYKVREVKGKDGKSSLAITDRNDKRTNMRAGGLTEARKLITSANKFKKQSAKQMQQDRDKASVDLDKRELSNRTKQQRRQDIDTLSQMPLKELRRKQDLVKSQQSSNYKQYMAANDPVTRERMERGARNLMEMDNDLIAAIDKQVFGTGRKKIK